MTFLSLRSLTSLPFLALLALLALLAPPPAEAYFQRWEFEPRLMGMGGVGTARGESSTFALANPAALADLTDLELRGTYGRLWWGLSDGTAVSDQHIGFALPIGPGGWGASWQGRGLEQNFQEDRFSISFGGRVSELWNISLGASLHWLRVNFPNSFWTDANSSLTQLTPSAMSISVGGQLKVHPDLTVGIAVLDINQPRLSTVNELVSTPLTVRVGASGRLGIQWTVDMDHLWRNGVYTGVIGTEYTLDPSVLIRGGVRTGTGPGTSFSLLEVDSGASIRWATEIGALSFDYAFAWPLSGASGTAGTHRAALSLNRPLNTGPAISISSPPPQPIALLPLPLGFLTMDFDLIQERDQILTQVNANPDDTVLIHRAALLSAVTGLTDISQTWFRRLMTLDAQWERLAIPAIHHLRYDPQPDVAFIDLYRTADNPSNPDSISSEISLGKGFLLFRAGRTIDALVPYRQWLTGQSHEVFNVQEQGGGVIHLIYCAVEAGDLKTAREKLELLPSDSPWTAEMKGRIALKEGQIDLTPRPDSGPITDKSAKFEEAVASFNLAMSLAPSSRTHYNLGVALYQTQRFEEALSHFRKAEETSTGGSDHSMMTNGVNMCRIEAIKYFLKEGDRLKEAWQMQDAIATYQKIFLFAPGHDEIPRAGLGPTVDTSSSFKEASARIELAKRRTEEHVKEFSQRAEEETGKTNFEQALIHWTNVLKADPAHMGAQDSIINLSRVMFRQVEDHLKEGQVKTAYRILSALEREPDFQAKAQEVKRGITEGFVTKATEAQSKELYPQAKELWGTILELNPLDEQAAAALTQITLIARQKAGTFLKNARDALAQKEFVAASINAGNARMREPDLPGLSDFERQLKNDSAEFLQLRLNQAETAIKTGAHAQARSALDDVLKFDPSHAKAKSLLASLAASRADRLKRLWDEAKSFDAQYLPEKAMEKLQELIATQSGHTDALALKATIEGRLAKAKESEIQVKEFRKNGNVLYGGGQLENAIQQWEAGLDLDYYNIELRKLITETKKERQPK